MNDYMNINRGGVRAAVEGYWGLFGHGRERAAAGFDRWFAEELRKAKEEAWREGMNYAMPPDAVLLYSDNPYRKGE